jgi:hypothetical protein
MPPDYRFRPKDFQRVQNIRMQLIKSGKHPTIDVAEDYPLSRFTPQYIELMPKNKDFGLQGSPRPEQPDDSAPDQSAEIAHSSDYQPIRR